MNLLCRLISIFSILFPCCVNAQVIKGKITDASNGEPLFAVVVGEKGTGNGTTTDFDGAFSLKVEKLPITLVVGLVGYIEQNIEVSSAESVIQIKLSPNEQVMSEVNITSDRILEKQKLNPLTVETMDAIAVKDCASGNFYESLGTMKGVDMTSASLGFRIINTRGFNSTSPVRTLQLIDGVDNQSPGLNFSLGNFLGACDLDVKKVEIVQGASSAFFGPGAFNGVVNMETKDPWTFKGLTAQLKVGERSLVEPQIRYAESIADKNGNDFFAYKICAYYLKAMDWEAENYSPIYGGQNDASNPGRFDAVNIYGDEYFPAMDLSDATPWNYRGIGTYYRTGYKEGEVLDYDTKNLKASASLHFRLDPEKNYDSPELVVATNIGTGTTVYQGDNRFRLRDIFFMQNRVELKKKDDFFVRFYTTREDAGNSYDPYATSLRILDEARSDEEWAKVYLRYWNDSIDPRIDGMGYPGLVPNPNYNGTTDTNVHLPYDFEGQKQWLIDNNDSLTQWHTMVANWTNNGNGGLVGINPTGYYAPGSASFDEAFNRITSLKNNEGEGGTRFFDKSSLYHFHAEKQFSYVKLDEWRIGANCRLYTPNSEGTIFSDTGDVRIRNFEVGFYTGIEKKLMEDKMILSATVRADKNQNFNLVVSPAASVVYSPKKNHYARISFSSALRNPTLADQYLYLNVGPATLSGNLNGRDSLVTLDSWSDFRGTLDSDTLDYFNIDPIRPEQVRTIEAGYRASIGDNIYVDGGYYFSAYTHFIGYMIGLDVEFDDTPGSLPKDVDAYRYAANSVNKVLTQGLSVGVNYYLFDYYTLNGNYSWNQLVKADENDPIIPAFNTPEHKFNLGVSGRGIKLTKETQDEFGFGVNYKWIQEFLFEGSPQFTGYVPSYDLVDAQVNYLIKKANTTVKIGCSNLMNNKVIQTYGGPAIGRLGYLSVTYEL